MEFFNYKGGKNKLWKLLYACSVHVLKHENLFLWNLILCLMPKPLIWNPMIYVVCLLTTCHMEQFLTRENNDEINELLVIHHAKFSIPNISTGYSYSTTGHSFINILFVSIFSLIRNLHHMVVVCISFGMIICEIQPWVRISPLL